MLNSSMSFNHERYLPNTTLLVLDPTNLNSLRFGEFGIIWWIWKPHGLPSVQGYGRSLLDELIDRHASHPLIRQALDEFGIDGELGMLTRLDNDTAGMVWFARTHESKLLWLQAQSEGKINKVYEADVIGWIKNPITIDTPIMHHRYDDTRMITINNKSDTNKGRWNTHQVSTHIIPWIISWNNTHIQAIIHQWCRHQIRIHCASYGNPIIGEIVYHKQQTDNFLHLVSIGLDRDQLKQAIVVNVERIWQK